MRIALLEDNADRIGAITRRLIATQHTWRQFGSSSDLTQALSDETFDLFIIGCQFGDASRIAVFEHHRQIGRDAPAVIMLARRPADLTRVPHGAPVALVA